MYLYIFENGAFYQSNIPPTHEDMVAFHNGHLTIVTFCKETNLYYELTLDEQYIPSPTSPVVNDTHEPGTDTHS